jgi:hypothetical protein
MRFYCGQIAPVCTQALMSAPSSSACREPTRDQIRAQLLDQPPVARRGSDGFGTAAMRCSMCHQDANFDRARVPGHAAWHLAPREMAWQNKTTSEICAA